MLEQQHHAARSADDVFAPLATILGGGQRLSRGRPYAGPERRSAASQQHKRLAQLLDTLDHAVLLLSSDGRVEQMNKAARLALDAWHPLQLDDGHLLPRLIQDGKAWHDALQAAATRGLRRMLSLGSGRQRIDVAVVPLAPLGLDATHGVALLLGRHQVCEPLTLEFFARCHGLTFAETGVIKGLCADFTPQQVATRQGVGLATVRTQIGSIRQKTGAGSIRALIRQLSLLPPLVGLLDAGSGLAREPSPPLPIRPSACDKAAAMPC